MMMKISGHSDPWLLPIGKSSPGWKHFAGGRMGESYGDGVSCEVMSYSIGRTIRQALYGFDVAHDGVDYGQLREISHWLVKVFYMRNGCRQEHRAVTGAIYNISDLPIEPKSIISRFHYSDKLLSMCDDPFTSFKDCSRR